MKKRTSLILIYGGRSGEHEVSVASATSIAKALSPRRYDVTPVRIGKDGVWRVDRRITGGKEGGVRYLAPDPTVRRLLTASGRKAEPIDVVFPIVHGTYGEDGSLQGLLELAGVPYVGAGVTGSAIGMDKVQQKRLLGCAGFPVTEFVAFHAAEWREARTDVLADVERVIGYPNFVKPVNLGSSVGINKAHHRKELLDAVAEATAYDDHVLVERAVPDAREIECAVLGAEAPEASVLGEIVPSNEFYDYAAKYIDDRSRTIVPARLPAKLGTKLRDVACAVFSTLGAEGMGRVDFLVNKGTGEWFVNEMNTLPGFTSISMYPKLWTASGLPYPKLLDRLVSLAEARADRIDRLVREVRTPKAPSI